MHCRDSVNGPRMGFIAKYRVATALIDMFPYKSSQKLKRVNWVDYSTSDCGQNFPSPASSLMSNSALIGVNEENFKS